MHQEVPPRRVHRGSGRPQCSSEDFSIWAHVYDYGVFSPGPGGTFARISFHEAICQAGLQKEYAADDWKREHHPTSIGYGPPQPHAAFDPLRHPQDSHTRELAALEQKITQLQCNPVSFSVLHAKSKEDFSQARVLAHEVAKVPNHSLVHKRLGLDLLLWAYCFGAGDRENLKGYLEDLEIRPPYLLEAYYLLNEKLSIKPDGASLLANHDLFLSAAQFQVSRNKLHNYILSSCMPENPKHSYPHHKRHHRKYQIALEVEEHFHQYAYSSWVPPHDGDRYAPALVHLAAAPFKLALYFDLPNGFSEPQYLVSFYATSADCLFIPQLQSPTQSNGVWQMENTTWHPQGLGSFDHKQTLLALLADLAKELGFSKLGMRSAANNPWTKATKDKVVHLSMERAIKIYDQSAKQFGMKLDESDGNYYIHLGGDGH